MVRRAQHREARTYDVPTRVRCWALLLLLMLPLLVVPALGSAQGTNRAGVVVVSGNGEVHTACVSFAEPSIGGLELLEQSGLDVTMQLAGGNGTVCSIAGEGCIFPRETCFCQCQGGGACRYWSYWHLAGGGWQYATAGAPGYRVQPGGVDGWVWGAGDSDQAVQPPAVSFDAICPAPEEAQQRSVATALSSPAGSPAATPAPTFTASPAPTTIPSAMATATEERQPEAASTTAGGGPAVPEASPSSSTASYLLFGGTAGLLLAAIILAWRRRR